MKTFTGFIIPPSILRGSLGHIGANLNLTTVSAAASEAVQTLTPPAGYAGFSSVNIAAALLQAKKVSATKTKQTITADSGYYGMKQVTIDPYVPQTETKSVTITTNGTTSISKSEDVDGMTQVNVTVDVASIKDISTAAEMDAQLVPSKIGRAFHFTGTTDTKYTNDYIYIVED